VIVTVVLLNVAFTWATPKVTLRRTLRRLLFDTLRQLLMAFDSNRLVQ
jgi:hypothetical protein